MTDIYRFYNTENGVHFYTASATERDSVISSLPTFSYEGTAFSVDETTTATTPVYRFLKTDGTHFYTSSESEREQLESSNPDYQLEGVAYQASLSSSGSNDTALYRFYNTETGTHFYTASASERDSVADSLSQYQYEGIAYYVDGAEGATVSFDESWYLLAYPDVADAVAAGDFTSGQQHYTLFGEAAGRLPTDEDSLDGAAIREGTSVFNGGRGDDYLDPSSSSAFRIFGETGNDTLVGDVDGDYLNGGSGDDVYVVSHPGVTVAEGITSGGTDTVIFSFSSDAYSLSEFSTPANVESVQLVLALQNGDAVTLDRAFSAVTVSGTGSLTGTSGDDYISAGPNVVVDGGAGQDTLRALIENDTDQHSLRGGDGADQFQIQSDPDAVIRYFGHVRIEDFDASEGDSISFLPSIGSVSWSVADGPDGAVVTFSGHTDVDSNGSTVTLVGISAADFQDSWFV